MKLGRKGDLMCRQPQQQQQQQHVLVPWISPFGTTVPCSGQPNLIVVCSEDGTAVLKGFLSHKNKHAGHQRNNIPVNTCCTSVSSNPHHAVIFFILDNSGEGGKEPALRPTADLGNKRRIAERSKKTRENIINNWKNRIEKSNAESRG